MEIDATHDPARRSWVESANAPESEFPIQNLPLGVFSLDGRDSRPGVAIGTQVLDLRALSGSALPAGLGALLTGPDLDPLLAAGAEAIGELRVVVGDLLDARCDPVIRGLIEQGALVSASDCRMHLPSSVRSFTDFYAGVFHARTSGVLMKSDPPLPRSYGNMPLAYNGRASSVRISGEDVRRPRGQRLIDGRPEFGASRWLDFELEVGAVIAGSNALGDPVPIGQAERRVAGFCLLNDWSARDIQLWEMPPLGAFNSKAFSTTISPWIVTSQAMAPYRTALMDRIPDQAPVAPYLIDDEDQASGGLAISLEVCLSTASRRASGLEPARVVETDARHLYWTFAQMVAQHTVSGANLCPGDVFGSGTVSGPNRTEAGSLAELTMLGEIPITLEGGETRTFLEDGDEVIFRARCVRDGFRWIGFGECRGRILAAHAD